VTTIAVAFLLAFSTAVIFTRVVIFLAWRLGAVDEPDGFRKLHRHPVPFGGGIPIFVAFAVPVIGLLLFPQLSTVAQEVWHHIHQLRVLYTSAALVLVLGMVDDALDIRPAWKLAGQTVVGVVAYAGGFRVESVSNPFGPPLELGVFALPVTVLWFLGCMNAVNLLDGLDGLAAGVTVFVGATMLVVALHFENLLAMLLMACLSGAALGFLMYNFPPARIFLGDGGSQLLGFLIGSLSLLGVSRKAETAVALFIPVVALGLPIIDTLVAIVRRWYKRLPISSPDRQHIHHILVAMGYSHRRAVMILYLVTVLLGSLAFLMTVSRSEVVVLLLSTFLVVGFVAVRVFSGVRLHDALAKLASDRQLREQETQARLALERARAALARVRDMEQMWEVGRQVFAAFDMEWARLAVFADRESDYRVWGWERAGAREKSGLGTWSATLPLRHEGRVLGELVLGRSLTRDRTPIWSAELLRQLADMLGSVLARLRSQGEAGSSRTGREAKQ